MRCGGFGILRRNPLELFALPTLKCSYHRKGSSLSRTLISLLVSVTLLFALTACAGGEESGEHNEGAETGERSEQSEGGELNETMVRIGMALAYRDQSLDYVADEAAAEREDVGVWQTRFDAPWERRAAQRH